MTEIYDCIIIGGGPAGLTAAIYLARYRRNFLLFDAGGGRASMIPRSHNQAAFPDGVSGPQLLEAMRAHASRYGAEICDRRVTSISRRDVGFQATSEDGGCWRSRTLLLATGVVNRRPPIDAATHDRALAEGLLRYCPVCDAFEARGVRIGVIGATARGASEAVFLRTYSDRITLLTLAEFELSSDDLTTLDAAGIRLERSPVLSLNFLESESRITLEDGRSLTFDTIYPALGSDPTNGLARMIGARTSKEGCIVVDAHQETTVSSVYAVGDVVECLDQISVAMGHSAIASTAIHNALREHAKQAHPPPAALPSRA